MFIAYVKKDVFLFSLYNMAWRGFHLINRKQRHREVLPLAQVTQPVITESGLQPSSVWVKAQPIHHKCWTCQIIFLLAPSNKKIYRKKSLCVRPLLTGDGQVPELGFPIYFMLPLGCGFQVRTSDWLNSKKAIREINRWLHLRIIKAFPVLSMITG